MIALLFILELVGISLADLLILLAVAWAFGTLGDWMQDILLRHRIR